MKLNRETYLDKVKGCFTGKNIGGTMGGPFEGQREMHNIKGFTTPKGEPLPNDDLDLQIVWLQALEDHGPKHIDSEMLGEYWLSFITPFWNEYGISKVNMERGIAPSVAGDMENNIWKHSNGSWIRTEIWACLAPCAVDTAVKYAIEDALVDHGTGEGTYASMFVAALESAAFIVSDINELIDIGLSKISTESRVYKTVEFVRDSFKAGKDYATVRNDIVEMNKDIGDGWFQAPNNIGFVVIGLLYGKGDFKKSMLTAINCGDDTDCTAATVGSILGIVYGDKKIPTDWKEYIGDRIITLSINRGVSFRFSNSITDLVKRIEKQTQYLLNANFDKVELTDGKTEFDDNFVSSLRREFALDDERDDIRGVKYSFKPNTFKTNVGPLTVVVTYNEGNLIENNKEKQITVMAINNIKAFGNQGYTVKFDLIVPEGFKCYSSSKETYAPCWTPMTKFAYTDDVSFTFTPGSSKDSIDTCLLKVCIPNRGKEYYIPIKFVRI